MRPAAVTRNVASSCSRLSPAETLTPSSAKPAARLPSGSVCEPTRTYVSGPDDAHDRPLRVVRLTMEKSRVESRARVRAVPPAAIVQAPAAASWAIDASPAAATVAAPAGTAPATYNR